MAGVQQLWNYSHPKKSSEELLLESLLSESTNPFDRIQKMRKQMMKQLPSDDDLDEDQFNLTFGDEGMNPLDSGRMTQREDDQYIYYEVPLRGLKEEKLDVQVSQGQVTISGKVEKKSEEKGNSTFFSSSFHRSFPVPPGVDAEHLQVEPEKDKFVIKFPKKK